MSTTRYYAGVGSRSTPDDVQRLMYDVAARLAGQGYRLRSGGAQGADDAFENGCRSVEGRCDIYLPWRGFNGRWDAIVLERLPPADLAWAVDIARAYHPAWVRLGRGPRALMARNTCQVLGSSPSSPRSSFVLCWTPGAAGGGGTGQAIRIARAHDIPVFDLADAEVRTRLERFARYDLPTTVA